MKWTKPSKIQKEALPVAIKGKDVIGLAETGSGKTGAFAIPINSSAVGKAVEVVRSCFDTNSRVGVSNQRTVLSSWSGL